MAINRANVFASAAHVYIAARTDPNTPVAHDAEGEFDAADAEEAGWKDVGSVAAGGTKLSGERFSAGDQEGTFPLGVSQKLDIQALEVTSTMISTLEAFDGKKCDILLKPVNSGETRVLKMLGVTVGFHYDGPFDFKETLKLPISAEATAKKVSDIISHVTTDWVLPAVEEEA